MSQKPAIRVRNTDGKPRDWKALHKALGGQTFVRVHAQTGNVEFILAVDSPKQLDVLREKLGAAGVEEIVGGDTTIAAPTSAKVGAQQSGRRDSQQRRGNLQGYGQRQLGGGQQRQKHGGRSAAATTSAHPLPGKPYGFVALPKDLKTAPPVWHDGTSSVGRLSGEIRFELETLSPLLVGWERQTLNESEEAWGIPLRKVNGNECAAFVQAAARATYPDATDSDEHKRQRKQQKVEDDRRKYIERVQEHIVDVLVHNAGWSVDSKSALCPLRAPWGKRPVIIPGDSLKGLLRHELGALLGAPMERVAERSYSYRPNTLFPNQPNPKLIARMARVPNDGVEMSALDAQHQVRVPTKLELLPTNLRYDRKHEQSANYYRFDDSNGATYRGGQGAGKKLNSKRPLHARLTANPSEPTETATLSQTVQDGYLQTVRHLIDLSHGHFSERHPDVPGTVSSDDARSRILQAAKDEVFQPGDLIWIEWDTERNCIVSVGWHYYYRWAYTDSVRRDADAPRLERHGLFPLDEERAQYEDGEPKGLSSVRRLFGYAIDKENPGVVGIGEKDHTQLMSRVSVNAGLEMVSDRDTDDHRFLKPTLLKELGMPRPSAVEHYIKQPHHPQSRASDRATLVTYGDAAGYDAPGELAGRKFYLDRMDAYTGEPWKDDSESNRINDRSTLALEASKPGRRFRFTLRFRDLEPAELAAVLVALCPDQFKTVLGGAHALGYCSKLGYARPLGWGSVCIEAKALLWLDAVTERPAMTPETDLAGWIRKNHVKTPSQDEWLAIHRRKHPDAADYPRARDRDGNANIYTFHTTLRAEHSRARRYKNGGTQ
jgi:CRISPR-associated protein (TIGR03986 family)